MARSAQLPDGQGAPSSSKAALLAYRLLEEPSTRIAIQSQSLSTRIHSEWLPFVMAIHSEWLRNNPQGPQRALGPRAAPKAPSVPPRAQRARRQAAPSGAVRPAREALRAGEPEKTRKDIMALRLSSTQRARRLCRNAVENWTHFWTKNT